MRKNAAQSSIICSAAVYSIIVEPSSDMTSTGAVRRFASALRSSVVRSTSSIGSIGIDDGALAEAA